MLEILSKKMPKKIINFFPLSHLEGIGQLNQLQRKLILIVNISLLHMGMLTTIFLRSG